MLTRIKRLIMAAGCWILWIVAALDSCASPVIIVVRQHRLGAYILREPVEEYPTLAYFWLAGMHSDWRSLTINIVLPVIAPVLGIQYSVKISLKLFVPFRL
jgi:hypothetical protein